VGCVTGEEAVHRVGRPVARLARVDDQHGPAGPAEHQRGGQTGRATTDDEDVDLSVCSGVGGVEVTGLLLSGEDAA
jgi:hypothetical protein